MADSEVQIMEVNDKDDSTPTTTTGEEGATVPTTTDAEPNGQATDLKDSSKDAVAEAKKTDEEEPPPPAEKSGMPEEFALNEVLQQLTSGTEMVKVKSRSKRFVRQYRISHDLHYLIWWPSRKSASHCRIDIASIRELRSGRSTELMQRAVPDIPEERCFTIIHGPKYAHLNLVANEAQQRNAWMHALEALSKINNSEERMSASRDKWLRQLFDSADVNGDGNLSLREISKMFHELNINSSHKNVKKKFQEADADSSGSLSFEEFAALFKELSHRPEIEVLFTKYASTHEYMTPADLRMFLVGEQSMCPTVEECQKLIQVYEPTDEGKSSGRMSLDVGEEIRTLVKESIDNAVTDDIRFSQYLLGEEGDVLCVQHRRVYQDMTQPLSAYFINSSHNTYLMEDQLKGPSSIEAYIRALRAGCRCVELDCWDGDEDDPVIYHGHTLTSKIMFKDAIQAINDHAFAVSECPVILSIENHCSVKQQHKMAEYMHSIFGDHLYTDPVDSERGQLPSPEELKCKILVKGKKLAVETEDDEGEVSEEDEADELDQGEGEGGAAAKQAKHQPKRPSKKKKKIKLANSLSKCVNYVQSIHFKGFESAVARTSSFFHMSSFAEAKALGYYQSKSPFFTEYNKRQLSRIYPAGWRVDSTNYNPVPLWNMGCQIVALNFQTSSLEIDINRGRFVQNGNCGCVLKPEVLRDEFGVFDAKSHDDIPGVTAKHYTVTIISGQSLPKPGSVEGEIIDPYVRLEVHGLAADKKEFKTKVVKDNGFNPQWNTSFSFKSIFPGLAILRFVVMDADTLSDDFIGQYSLPLESLSSGYRYVHILSPGGERLEQCTIFVHVQIENAADVAYEKHTSDFEGLARLRSSRHSPQMRRLNIVDIDEPLAQAAPVVKRAHDLNEDFNFTMFQFKMKTLSDPCVPVEECLQVLTWQRVVVEANGKVFLTRSDNNLVVRGIAIAFNNMNNVFDSTLKDVDEILASLKETHDSCKGQFKHVQEGLQNVDNKHALQLAVSYTRNMRTLYGLIVNLEEQKVSVQKDLEVIQRYAAEMSTVPGEAADL